MANREHEYENVGIESNAEQSQESKLYLDSCISDDDLDYDDYPLGVESLPNDQIHICNVCNNKSIDWSEERKIAKNFVQLK